MELRQLEYFVAVVDEGGFTRAAERLHVAQPGVSAQIRQLEKELGADLFHRTGRVVRLTDVGVAVLPYARAALAAVDGVRTAVGEVTGLLRGRVMIGVVSTEPSLDLPGLLADFHRDYPGVEISLVQETAATLADRVRDGRLDLAVMSLAVAAPVGLAFQVLMDEPMAAVVRHDHELAGVGPVPIERLKDLPLISLVHGTGLRAVLEEGCARAGFRPYVAFEAAETHLMAQLAARGLGIALGPRTLVSYLPELCEVPLVEPVLHCRLGLVWRADEAMSPAATALLERARAALPSLPYVTEP